MQVSHEPTTCAGGIVMSELATTSVCHNRMVSCETAQYSMPYSVTIFAHVPLRATPYACMYANAHV